MSRETPFWASKSLSEMSDSEWESLCDGCALCCMHKVEDEDTGEVFYTDVACKLLDLGTCRCTDYARRTELVADCLRLTPDERAAYDWLPATCAYRRLFFGQGLPEWHPLITGRAESVHEAGISLRDEAVSERDTEEYSVYYKL